MAGVPLRDIVNTAHSALESGDYAVARAACQHVLAHFPYFADVHRLGGEIALEQGETESAKRSFEQALSFDPQNVLATLGLGVIAEESLDLAHAAQSFQRALEIDPSLVQLRDELVRLYSKLYGQGGRLHVSGPGLAAIYARGNQLTLARRQYEQMLSREPERLDLSLALAEVCWRRGDIEPAMHYCQQILSNHPRTVRALYLQADILRQHGDMTRAREAYAAATEIDPLGDIAALLDQANPNGLLGQLAGPTPTIAELDSATALSLLEASRTAAPAEDQEWRRITTELNAAVLDNHGHGELPEPVESTGGAGFQWPWEQRPVEGGQTLAAGATPANELIDERPSALFEPAASPPAPPTEAPGHETEWSDAEWEAVGAEIEAARPGSTQARGYTDTLREIEDLGFKPFNYDSPTFAANLPNDLPTMDSLASAPTAPLAALPPSPPPPANESIDPAKALQELIVGKWDSIDQELAAATPSDTIVGYDDLTSQLAESGVMPFTNEATNDGPGGLLAADWEQLDTAPAGELPRGFTRELAALQSDGLAPFAYDELDASQPPTPSDERASPSAGAGATSSSPAGPLPPAIPGGFEPGELERGWADLKAEFGDAIPATGALPGGFTAELRDLNDQGLTPFVSDEPTIRPSQVSRPTEPAPASLPPATPASLPPATPASLLPATPASLPPADELVSPTAELRASFGDAIPATGELPTGFTNELRDLNLQGLIPFANDEPPRASAPPAPPTAPPAPPNAPPPSSVADGGNQAGSRLLALNQSWADIEAELEAATPPVSHLPRGFTNELSTLEHQGLAPFIPDDLFVDAESASQPVPLPAPELELQLGRAEPSDQSAPPTERPTEASAARPALPPATPSKPAVTPTAAPSLPAMPTNPPAAAAPAPSLPSAPFAPLRPAAQATPAPIAPGEPHPLAAPIAPESERPSGRPLMPSRPSGGPGRPTTSAFGLGQTLKLAAPLFEAMRSRKLELLESGHLTLQRVSPVPVGGPLNQLAAAQQQVDEGDYEPAALLALAAQQAAADQVIEAARSYRLLLRGEPTLLAELVTPIERLAASHRDQPAVARLLGELYMHQGRYSQAISVFRNLMLAGASA